MKLDLLGHYHRCRPSLLDRLPAGVKLLAALVLITGTVLAPARWTGWFVGAGLVLVLGLTASRLPLGFLLKRLLVLSPFVLGVALVQALHPGPGGGWQLTLVKSGLCLSAVILVANTTPFSQTLRVLGRAGLPRLLLTTLALMHRYLFVLAEEAQRMHRARASRTFVPTRRGQWQSRAALLGQLFVRASERAERIYAAMCARGWQ